MIRPGSKCAQIRSQQTTGKRKDRRYQRTGPSPSKVGKFRNRLGEEHLVGVALEIAQNGCSEDRSDDNDPKQRDVYEIEIRCVGLIQQDFAVAGPDRSKTLGGDTEKTEGCPRKEVNVRRNALAPEPELKCEKFAEHFHGCSSWRPNFWHAGKD